jgi:putative phosphonate metabolism protein
MRFEVIGVQLDQAGHDQVAAGILAAGRRLAVAELGDAAIGDGDPAALDHVIRQNDPGVAKDGFGSGRSHLKASSFIRLRPTLSRQRGGCSRVRRLYAGDMTAVPRYAIYYAAAAGNELDRFGAHWLGYDARSGKDLPFPNDATQVAADWRELTRDPRKYGFHATLKAPMALAPGKSEAELLAACASFAREPRTIPVIRPVVDSISGFIAVVPSEPCAELERLAADCVREFDSFRAPLTPQDRARRNPSALTPRQCEQLDRWGYPYVMQDFRFHMTLTGRLDAVRREPILAMLRDRFSALSLASLAIDQLALFRQDDADSRFRILKQFLLASR